MKCSCGYENEANAVYCVGCGKPLAEAQGASSGAEPKTDKPVVTITATVPPQASPPPAAEAAGAQTTAQPPQAAISAAKAQTPPPGAPQGTQPGYPPPQQQQAQAYPYYYQYPPYPQRPASPSPFTITDVFVILGFVLAILGVFWYAYILLPASILFSILGWSRKTNKRTNNLSVAALIVGICAILIKIGTVLYELELVPEWLSRGIF